MRIKPPRLTKYFCPVCGKNLYLIEVFGNGKTRFYSCSNCGSINIAYIACDFGRWHIWKNYGWEKLGKPVEEDDKEKVIFT